MTESSRAGFREFLPSANQALAALEQATGQPVQILEDPQLKVLATIRRAAPGEACHLLRIRGGENRVADYLITFECRMALRDGSDPRAVLRDNTSVREQVISACEGLHRHLPAGRAQELGRFIYSGLILQLRSMGPGMLVDRWIREHCPDLREAQAQAIAAEISNNLPALQPSTRANYPATVYDASIAMNAAYAIHGGDLLGKPYLAVPYISQGYGEIGRRLIALAIGGDAPGPIANDRQIIDAWAEALALSGWYEWASFDGSLLHEAAREPGSEAFRVAVTSYYKDAYREAGGRVDVAFSGGVIEVSWEPQADQLPASATINEQLQAGRYDEAIPLLRTRLQLEPDHVESL